MTFANSQIKPKSKSPFVQAKLTIGQPGDKYEQEADAMADQVMRMPQSDAPIQRQCEDCEEEALQMKPLSDSITPVIQMEPMEEEDEMVQTKSEGNSKSATSNLASQLNQSKGGGRGLSDTTNQQMSGSFGTDFSKVRVHTDSNAVQLNRSLNARAFTHGNDVYFNKGEYNPNSGKGKHLLAHELTHVVQQDGVSQIVQRYTTEDCNDSDNLRIEATHTQAINMVSRAISRLTADPVTAETQTHFSNHFGGYGSWRRDVVVGHFQKDLVLLNDSTMTYQCESDCTDTPSDKAYTYWVFGDIHLCLDWLRTEDLNERAETFIHELHHWDSSRGHLDLGYHENNQDNDEVWIRAVNNADSYSELAQDLTEQP